MPVEPMYMPGPQPDRLEAFEHGDVLGRVAGLCFGLRHNRRNACKTRVLRGTGSVSDRAVAALPREAQTDRFLHTFAQLFVARSRRRSRGPARRPPGSARAAARDGLVVGLRQRSGSEPDAAARRARSAISAAPLAELERPDRVGRVHVHACRPARCAPATRCARSPSPTAAGQRSSELGHAGLRAEARELGADLVYRADPGSTSTTCAGSTGSADACVAVIIVCPMPAMRSASTLPAAEVELREHVVEQQERRRRAAAPPRRAAARARRGAARPASRTGAGRGRRSRRARRRGAARARSCRARCRARGAPRAPRRVGGSRVVAEPRVRQAELAGALGERRRERVERRAARSTSAAPSAATRSVHGSSASRGRESRAARGAARRSAARAPRGSPAAAPARAGNSAPEHAVEVRAARGRARP